jgi:hypothetical protein
MIFLRSRELFRVLRPVASLILPEIDFIASGAA